MTKKQKLILGISIGLNIVLLVTAFLLNAQRNLVHEQLFQSQVEMKLAELEGVIHYQKEEKWDQPEIVKNQLSNVLHGIEAALYSGIYAKKISQADETNIQRLYNALNRFPHDELYKTIPVTEEDKKRFEQLQQSLQKAGWQMNSTIGSEWTTFQHNIEIFLDDLPSNN